MKKAWHDYYKKVAGREQHPILQLTLKKVQNKDMAYDLGCGAGEDSKYSRSKLLVGFLGNYNSLNTRSAYKCDLEIFFRFLTIVFYIDKDKSLINEINVEHAHLVVFKEYLQKISHGHSTINKISLL